MTSLEAASMSVPADKTLTSAKSSMTISSFSTEKTANVATKLDYQPKLNQMMEEAILKQSANLEGIISRTPTVTPTTASSPKPTNNLLTDIAQETLSRKTPSPLATTRIPQPQQSTALTTLTSAPTTPPMEASAPQQTKLQHDHQPYPLTALLHNQNNASTYPFRRSTSLRLRGSKCNTLFDALSNSVGDDDVVHGVMVDVVSVGAAGGDGNANDAGTLNVEQARSNNDSRDVNTRATTKKPATVAINATKERNQLERGTHERHKAGQFATTMETRRKFTPSGTPTQTPAISLTRSLSARRSYQNNFPYKTDAKKDNRANGAAAEGPVTFAVDRTGSEVENAVLLQNGPALNDNCEHQEAAKSAGNCVATSSNGDASQGVAKHDIMDGVANSSRNGRDVQKMSLNLNGAATTSKATSPLAPVTTGSGPNVSNKSTATTPKTPSYTQPSHYHHHHYQHQYTTSATKYVKSSPTAAPETKLTPKTPPVTPDSPCTYLDDDLDSMYSFATTTSGRSTMSCEHPYVARNGTTFSGRKMKYVVHCSNYAGQVGPDYLTPTQRAARQVRRLKELLCLARQDLEQKDSEILRLTREVVELRLFKASLSSPEERSASSDAVTVREAELKTSQDVSPIVDMVDDATKSSPRHLISLQQQHLQHQHLQHSSQPLSSEMQSSFADSGHFEDMTTSSMHSKDSYAANTQDIACGSDEAIIGDTEGAVGGEDASEAAIDAEMAKIKSYELQRQELIRMYEAKIEELIRTQDAASNETKRSHNDKVEALLQKLAECNTRYADIVPDYEHAKERIRELEKQLEDLQRKLTEHEEKQNKMYLHMYQKGQEAERIAHADQTLELAHRAPNNKVSINELLHQLQSTQDELENIRAAECRIQCGSNHALLTAKEAISLWVLGARKTIYRRLLEAQKNRTHVDPEVTLQFLKSAIYYFLTDKENSQGHLQAIESILEFTEAEKQNINKARVTK